MSILSSFSKKSVTAMDQQHGCSNQVLLVHGMDDTSRVFKKMKRYLEERGFVVHTIDLKPSDCSVKLEVLAQQLALYVNEVFGDGRRFSLVGFSMGGIVARYYLQRLGGVGRVDRFVTLSSPHHGTSIARLSKKPGAVQMRRGSAFLKDLNRDAKVLGKLHFVSVWTPFDLMIVPPTSSSLKVAKNISIPVPAHPLMVRDKRVMKVVAETLGVQRNGATDGN